MVKWKSMLGLRQVRLLPRLTTFVGKRAFSTEEIPTHFSIVLPANVSPQIKWDEIPQKVVLPPYAKSSNPPPPLQRPEIKDADTIQRMRESCKLARKVLDSAGQLVKVGLTTEEIDKHVYQMSVDHGAYPSPLNYKGFPKSVCTSLNNVVCHGIPDDRPLESGDIINIDITVFFNGVHGDCSETYAVGEVDEKGHQLLQMTRDCLAIGLEECGPDKPFAGIGEKIEEHAEKHGYSVVPMFIGHGIGSYFHGPPDIYHARNVYPGLMKPCLLYTSDAADE